MSNNFDFTSLLNNAKGLIDKAQQDLTRITVQSEAGAGLVNVTVNATHQITKLHIDQTLLKELPETVETLVTSAINDANRKIDDVKREQMSSLSNLFDLNPENQGTQ